MNLSENHFCVGEGGGGTATDIGDILTKVKSEKLKLIEGRKITSELSGPGTSHRE
jgi:hypothetical protein